MLKMLPMQVAYANRVNAIMRERYGKTIQDCKVTPQRVMESHDQGWTEEQFVAWVARTHDLAPATNECNFAFA